MKCALITGGSRGIGKAICAQLAKDTEYHILINYNSNEVAAKDTLKLVQEAGNTGEIIPFNVSDSDQVKSQSPAMCPNVSLKDLNPSTSIIISETGCSF